MVQSRSVNLLLVDGDTDGVIKCTVPNWTGIVYKIPRDRLEDCTERRHLRQTGVYMLFGEDDKDDCKVTYIGQAGVRKNGDGILSRLQEHDRNPDKDYWSEAVVFTTSGDSLGMTEISYLENQLCNMAISADRYIVKNSNDPTPGNITEEKEIELNVFIEYAKVVIRVLGYEVFVPVDKNKEKTGNQNKRIKFRLKYRDIEKLNISNNINNKISNNVSNNVSNKVSNTSVVESKTSRRHKKNVDMTEEFFLSRHIKQLDITVRAKGRQTKAGFVVLRGSVISPTIDKNISDSVKQLRMDAKFNPYYELLEDVMCKSSSTAAMFVIGKAESGPRSWVTKEGISLLELLQQTD